METKYYTCQYCKKEYIPKRRIVQKFCSNSCRAGFHHQKAKKKKNEISSYVKPKGLVNKTQKTSVDQVSVAGIVNAAVGTAIVDGLKHVFTGDGNMPATKNDIQYLASKIQRFQEIKNIPPNSFGKLPYFDLKLGVVVYE